MRTINIRSKTICQLRKPQSAPSHLRSFDGLTTGWSRSPVSAVVVDRTGVGVSINCSTFVRITARSWSIAFKKAWWFCWERCVTGRDDNVECSLRSTSVFVVGVISWWTPNRCIGTRQWVRAWNSWSCWRLFIRFNWEI